MVDFGGVLLVSVLIFGFVVVLVSWFKKGVLIVSLVWFVVFGYGLMCMLGEGFE